MEDGQMDAPPMRYPAAPNADHVGAGDACSAALLVGMVRDWSPMDTLLLANRMGAYVASVSGATPALPPEILAMARGNDRFSFICTLARNAIRSANSLLRQLLVRVPPA